MILPQTETPLIDFADQSKVSQSLLLQFIEQGGADFFINAWVAYATEDLKKTEFLNNLTPVQGLDRGRLIFEDIAKDFVEQFEQRAKEK